ncbi:MAG: SdrD B-like domain-containing protein [Cytophagales bacterium]
MSYLLHCYCNFCLLRRYKVLFSLCVIAFNLAYAQEGTNQNHRPAPKAQPKKKKESKIEVKGGLGFVFLPPFKEKTDQGGNITNIYSGFKPGPALWLGIHYRILDNLSFGGSVYAFATSKQYFKLRYITYSIDLKYNFLPTTEKISPYVLLGFNLANVFMDRNSYTREFVNADTLNPTGNDVIINRVNTSYGSLNSAYPSFGLSPGLGFQFRKSHRLGFFMQYTHFYNFTRNEKVVREGYFYNKSNLQAGMVSGGIIVHLGGDKSDRKLMVKQVKKKQNFNSVQAKNNYNRPKSGKANKPDPNRMGTYTGKSYSSGGGTNPNNQANASTKSELFFGKQKLTTLPSNTNFKNPVAVGKVVNDNGRTVADVDVLALDDNGNILGTSRTDKNGFFSFSKLEGKNANIVLSTQDSKLKATAAYREQDPSMMVSSEQMKKFEFNKLEKKQNQTLITGRLNVAANSAEGDDVEILLFDKDGNLVASTKSKNGFFAFQKIPAGDYQIVVNSNNQNLKAVLNLAEQDPDMFIPMSNFAKGNLSKLSSNDVSSIVTGKAFSSVPNAQLGDVDVLALNDKGEVVATTKTNKTGGFAFKNLPAASYQVVIDSKDPNVKAKATVVDLDPSMKVEASNFKFNKLESKKNTVVGKVNSNVNPSFSAGVDVMLLNDDGEVVGQTKTDRAGYFSFTKLDPANYQIAINSSNPTLSASVLGSEDGSSILSEKDFFARNANLQKLNSSPLGNVVVGTVSPNAKTSDVGDVEVLLLNDAGEVVDRTKTNAKGRFTFSKISQSNYQVVVANEQDNGLKAKVFVANAQDNAVVSSNDFRKYDYQRLNPNSNSNVLVGKFNANAVVSEGNDIGFLLLDENGQIVEELYANKTNGKFVVNSVKPGNYTVVPTDAGNANIQTNVYLANSDPSNKITPQDFLANGRKLSKLESNSNTNLIAGKVSTSASNEKTEDVSVMLMDDDGNIVAETKTNKDGRFQFKNLPKGNFKVVIDNPSPSIKANIMAIEDDPSMKLTMDSFKKFDYQKLGKNDGDKNIVVGKIEPTAFNKAVADISVLLMDDDGNIIETKTDKRGYFTFNKLSSKNYQVVVDSKNPEVKATFNVANSDPELYLTADEISKYKSDMILGNVESKSNSSVDNVEVLMLNDKGDILDKTNSNKKGGFAFTKIPQNTNLQVVVNTNDPNTSANARPVDSDPDLKLEMKQLFKFNSTTQRYEPLQSYDKIRLTGVVANVSDVGDVYLINEKGDVIAQSKTDNKGVFTFNKVQANENLRVVFENSEQKINAKFQIFQDQGSFDTKPDKPGKVFNSVYFDHNQTELTADDKVALDKFVAYMKANPKSKVNLNGFGDNTGTPEANMNVTRKRAEAVMKYLESQGIAKDRMRPNPMGKAVLCKSRYNKEDPKLNRRVDMEIVED